MDMEREDLWDRDEVEVWLNDDPCFDDAVEI